jgi:hypothetical protein
MHDPSRFRSHIGPLEWSGEGRQSGGGETASVKGSSQEVNIHLHRL